MASDDARSKPAGQRSVSAARGKMKAEKWAAFQQEYKRLAKKYGLKTGSTAKKKTKKKTARKTAKKSK